MDTHYSVVFSVSERRQTMLFSATQTRKIEDLARVSLKKEPLYIGVDDQKDKATVEGLEQVGVCMTLYITSIELIHLLPEVKCNSYIIKYWKFTTGNYSIARKRGHLPVFEDTSLPYLTLSWQDKYG